MAKHRRSWNEKKYNRYLQEGRGRGTLASYKPWITIQDFASKGSVSRVQGMTTGRIHHLLSSHELRYFYLLDWSSDVYDIREQYPLLELDVVIGIAEKAGIRYPFDRKSGFPCVLTSDFLITTSTRETARTIKRKADLKNPRVREKLEIERRYWTKRGIDWKIVTEDEINRQKSLNIEWLFQAFHLEHFIPDEAFRNHSLSYFEALYENSSCSIAKLVCKVEKELSLEPGIGINLFKHLVLTRRISIPLDAPLDINASRKADEMRREYG